MIGRNHYEILQVASGAEREVIEAAYRRLALKYHPDRNPGTDVAARMQELNAAYEVLGDPERRRQYDEERNSAGALRELEQSVHQVLDSGDSPGHAVEALVQWGLSRELAWTVVSGVVEARRGVTGARSPASLFSSIRPEVWRWGAAALTLLVVVGLYYSGRSVADQRLDFNKLKVFFSGDIDRAEAQKVGELLRSQGFGDKPATVQIRKPVRHEVRLVLRPEALSTPEVAIWERWGVLFSTDVFRNSPVDVHLCDNQLNTVRVIEFRWEPGAPHMYKPNVVAGAVMNEWEPAAGYNWAEGGKAELRAKWVPGSKHSRHPNVISADEPDNWLAAKGFRWIVRPPNGDFRVEPIPSLDGKGMTSSWITGTFTYDLIYTNGSESDLTEVRVTVTLYRDDGRVVIYTKYWAEWAKGESIKLNVPAHRYQKHTIVGYAMRGGDRINIDLLWTQNWK